MRILIPEYDQSNAPSQIISKNNLNNIVSIVSLSSFSDVQDETISRTADSAAVASWLLSQRATCYQRRGKALAILKYPEVDN